MFYFSVLKHDSTRCFTDLKQGVKKNAIISCVLVLEEEQK